MIWPIEDIVKYLDEYWLTFVTYKGKPSLQPQRGLKPGVIERILPHVIARRVELIAYFEDMAHGTPLPVARVETGPTRSTVLAELMKRAVASERVCYILCPDGLAVPINESLPAEIRREAAKCKWACVGGDSEWTKLPKE